MSLNDKEDFINTLIICFIFNLLDWGSTYLALSVGAIEHNIFYYTFLNGSIFHFLVFKIMIISIYFALTIALYNWTENYKKLVKYSVLGLTIFFVYLFINNMVVFFKMM